MAPPEPRKPRGSLGKGAITGARTKKQIAAQQARGRAKRAAEAAAKVSAMRHGKKKSFVSEPDPALLKHLVEHLESGGEGAEHSIQLGEGMTLSRTETGSHRGKKTTHFTLRYTWKPIIGRQRTESAVFERRGNRLVRVVF